MEYSLNMLIRTIRLSQKLHMVKTKQQKFFLKSLSEPQIVVKSPCLRKKGFYSLVYSKTGTSKTVSVRTRLHKFERHDELFNWFNHIMPGFLAQHFKWPSLQKEIGVDTTKEGVD